MVGSGATAGTQGVTVSVADRVPLCDASMVTDAAAITEVVAMLNDCVV
jgi:hypothetical protein